MELGHFPPRPHGGILGLDLARLSGWSYAVPGGEHVAGEWRLPPVEEWGAQCTALTRRLWELEAAYKPRWCGIEAPLNLDMHKEGNTRTGFGLAAHAASWAYQASIVHEIVNVNHARQAVLLDGGIPGAEQGKAIIMEWCRQRGWPVVGDNAADATICREYMARVRRMPGAKTETPFTGLRFWRHDTWIDAHPAKARPKRPAKAKAGSKGRLL